MEMTSVGFVLKMSVTFLVKMTLVSFLLMIVTFTCEHDVTHVFV